MLDTLESFLKSMVTPELMAGFVKANKLFDALELDYIDDDYQNILYRDMPPQNTIDELHDYTIGALDNILQQHDVTVVKELTDMELRCDLIQGLLIIPDYEDQSEILTIANMDLDAEERLAELLALVLPQEPNELLHHLESVSGSLVRKIIESARTGRQLDTEDELERAQAVRLYKRLRGYAEFLKTEFQEDLDVIVAVRDRAVPVNLNFLTYAKLVGRDFESMPERMAAGNLLGMALISFDGADNPLACIQRYIEHFISDMDKVTRVSGFAARELLMKFTAWESNRHE